MTRIGLISDVHATAEPVAEALAVFERERVDQVICAGDIAGYGEELEKTVVLLAGSGCRAILGNHDAWFLDADPDASSFSHRYLRDLPRSLELSVEGCRLFVVHASPPDSDMDGIVLLDEDGALLPDRVRQWRQRLTDFDFDVLIVGHTHQVFAEHLGATLVVNPGSTRFNNACAILTLPERQVETIALSGDRLVKAWHWGMRVQ